MDGDIHPQVRLVVEQLGGLADEAGVRQAL